ncbi:uncharacterized protein LOC105643761 isoform X1 [Jatropha curcas]|uniref:uncharacterized protein LOC105643761 isoform X1 n=1 Tax=Jatropha curcas TaxID=180498 RepID=UPI001893B706|nr:uncharacterized protein LOC105643761 isoform X1 [Jatropha curcas]
MASTSNVPDQFIELVKNVIEPSQAQVCVPKKQPPSTEFQNQNSIPKIDAVVVSTAGPPPPKISSDDQKVSTTSASPSSSKINSAVQILPTDNVLVDSAPLVLTHGTEKVSCPSDVDICEVNNKFSSLGYLSEGDRCDSEFIVNVDDLKKAGSMIAEKLFTGNVNGNFESSSGLGFIKVMKKQRNRKVKTAIELLKPTRRQKKTQASSDCIRPNEYTELES